MKTKILILLVGLTLSCGLSRADVVEYTVTQDAAQLLYQFRVVNSGATGGTIFDLFLSLPVEVGNIDTTSIGTPVGWGDPAGGLLFFGPDVSPSTSFIEWSSDFSGADDVAIGSSLAGYSFRTLQPIGPIRFALNGSGTFATAVQVSGVPEPGSFITLLVTAAVLGFAYRFRRLRERAPERIR
jgi:hypothetical protein